MVDISEIRDKYFEYTNRIASLLDEKTKKKLDSTIDYINVYYSNLSYKDYLSMICTDLFCKNKEQLEKYTTSEIACLTLVSTTGTLADFDIKRDYKKEIDIFDKEILNNLLAKNMTGLELFEATSNLNYCLENEGWSKTDISNFAKNSKKEDFENLNKEIGKKIDNYKLGV